MRFALLLLGLAAALSLAQYAPRTAQGEEVVAAVRRGSHPPAPTAANATLNVRNAASPSLLDQPREPPLFRPAQTPAALATPRSGESFALVGLVSRDGQAMAFVRDTVDGRSWRLRQGERAGDWTLAAMGQNCVTLTRGRRRQEICL